MCVRESERALQYGGERGEVKVHHGLAVSGDNVEKFGCLGILNVSNSGHDKQREIQ